MSDAINHEVVGTDGKVPVYNPEALWKTWSIDEIYTGTQGSSRYVPKVLDHVIEPRTGTRYVVTALSEFLIPTMEVLGGTNSITFNSTDLLFSVGPGWNSQNYRFYYDNTVFPYRLDVSAFLTIRAVQAAYVKVFRGSIYAETPEVISAVFDPAGNLVSDKVGLDLLASPDKELAVNYHIKTVKPFNTTARLVNGDVLTLVVYSSSHHVIGHTSMTVTESNFLRENNAATVYVTHISVESPFLSDNDPTLLNLPLNWTKASMNIMGVVHYSNGKEVRLPVDGRRMGLLGIDQVLSTIPGHEVDLNLVYFLQDGEASINETSVYGRDVNLPMRLRLVNANHSYSVKLFAFPRWDAHNSQYRLQWWLLNLERTTYHNVTNHVKFAANSPVFDGMAFGMTHRFQVQLNLRDVFPTAKPFIHTQVVEISLYGTPSDFESPWTVTHVATDITPFGTALKAKIVSGTTVSLANDFTTYEQWRHNYYELSFPIVEHPEIPNSILEPTHFLLIGAGGASIEYPIEAWNRELSVSGTLKYYDTLTVIFIRRISTGDLYLSVSAITAQP